MVILIIGNYLKMFEKKVKGNVSYSFQVCVVLKSISSICLVLETGKGTQFGCCGSNFHFGVENCAKNSHH